MIVIVGQNPSTAKQKKNSTFDRLSKWTKAVGLESYDFMNCSDDPGDKYEIDYERLSATKKYKKVIALGGVASKALSKVGVEHFKMPHPSPRNRQLNDKQFEIDMLFKMKEYLL